ncbi:MAG: hypothetical protein EA350_14180 [Gemmatimonadales bacterium]|nr:MAG: hypothetical protein EA350_14180 [Gemmatimonadales bacterium]
MSGIVAGALAAALAGVPPLAAQSGAPSPDRPGADGTGEVHLPDDARSTALADLAALDVCFASRASSPEADLQRLRTLYLLAVDDKPGLERAWGAHRKLVTSGWARTPGGRAVVDGYRGALIALEARHGFWPHARIRDLRQALDLLDGLVEASPTQEEVRYLRLVSTAFLPGILGRSGTVDTDLEILARRLPQVTGRYPLRTWTAMADTVEELLAARGVGAADEVRVGLRSARRTAAAAAIPLVPGCRVG